MKEYKVGMWIQRQVVKVIGHVGDRYGEGIEIGTCKEWDAWEVKAWKECKGWMVLDLILSEIGYCWDSIWGFVWVEPKYYIMNRYIRKSHIIECKGIEVGGWSDCRDRLFFGIMEECKRFLEVSHPEYIGSLEHGGGVFWDVTGMDEDEIEEFRKDFNTRMGNIKECILAYYWYKDVYPLYEGKVKELYDEIVLGCMDEDTETKKRNSAIYKQLGELEREIELEKVTHLKGVVGCLDYLFDD